MSPANQIKSKETYFLISAKKSTVNPSTYVYIIRQCVTMPKLRTEARSWLIAPLEMKLNIAPKIIRP